MASSTVSIGGITLRGHEVPSKIPFGGKQRIAKNVLIGGKRVPDAMGFEFCDAKWEGRFRGADAKARALAINAMAKRGSQVPLSWGGLYFTVIVEEFEADYQREFDLPYRITCYVVDDGGSAAEDIGSSIGSLIGADIASALPLAALAGGLVGDAMSGLFSAVNAVGSLADIPLSRVGPLQDTASVAVATLDTAIAAGDAAITAAAAPDPNALLAPGFAASVTGALAAIQAQSNLTTLRGGVGRLSANLSLIG
ncbi:hypothetical protein [Methylobacterium haplocladii]|uniref:Tail protein n=1 Tax=Methylobacterium haplocladii TaxID=1176176 RepID=A0A512ISF7_9HYPH|nr:hypothetical protein [Methylobacterium haplocladii]GEP00630.1 hypothetical protein MHA02_30170 [Methylobacterium haplocladii]GJD85545.1 hypothetical protein HPGCJGGD_3434 [Methylobacterium haplocladii]GLS57778.1 hypothetical protein GCM10007887_04340 [Methylobacterium haplocladii]